MNNFFTGTIIEESLEDKSVLESVKIVSTRVSHVTDKHKTPWIKIWTLHSVEVSDKDANNIAKEISNAIDSKHIQSWYVDYKNDLKHYIIFKNKVFYIDRTNKNQYNEAIKYGLSLGIPKDQLDFDRFMIIKKGE